MKRSRLTASCAVALVALLAACSPDPAADSATTVAPATTEAAPVTEAAPETTEAAADTPAHVFIVMLENTSFDQTFGPNTDVPYLATDLRNQGVLLENFYGIAHVSQSNYIAQISGQAPNPSTQLDCSTYTEFVQTGTAQYDQALGDGCVYPSNVLTIADQLSEAGLTWRAYAEDMGASTTDSTTCRHPEIGAADGTMGARPGDEYATRHVPFVYFHSIIDSADCSRNVVDLNELDTDLASIDTTRNLTYIVPGLCSDGHDHTCVDGSDGWMKASNEWLSQWIPKILNSAAFKDNGLLIITFDEATIAGEGADASGCCGDLPTPNLTTPAGLSGPGGGRVGAVLIGSAITPGSTSTTDYNHYSLLCSLENMWGLDKLGYAGHPLTPCFGDDVFSADPSYATPMPD